MDELILIEKYIPIDVRVLMGKDICEISYEYSNIYIDRNIYAD